MKIRRLSTVQSVFQKCGLESRLQAVGRRNRVNAELRTFTSGSAAIFQARPQRIRRSHGFSLIELMIVVGIMAIVMATGVPKMLRTMQKEGLRKAESDLLEACGTARAQAIVNGVPMDLIIKAEDSSMTVQPAGGSGASLANREDDEFAEVPSRTKTARFSAKLDDGVAIRELAVNFKSQMDQAEARVRFFPNGTSDEFTILFFSSQGERMISLDLVTGLAKLEVIR